MKPNKEQLKVINQIYGQIIAILVLVKQQLY